MKLILSDKNLDIQFNDEITFFDLSSLKIENCTGCYNCWVKTPGKCVIRDDAVKIYPEIAKSNKLMYVSKVKYGSYDTIMKTMLERALPIQQAFIHLIDGECHHYQRDVAMKNAIIIAYGNITTGEKRIFEQLVNRNSYNMNFSRYKVIFTSEEKLEKCIEGVVPKWRI
ncbi:hypothetical protein AN640_01345 [Candidatus Epulonipiscium fishelsonii]|uniref:Uncharacterized protein n=1 Tax=Candidatus Epulonipiscium fishelsonii TaxID=77094 RepID=A0ACC8XE98_9FIRM|nr:hypothetical protein AN640_01345 [Epulopiscium sp. SCG-D08WGA-EpuloA1]OON91098.1 MAG: hypothetical protein ATN32_02610 [Epulopiscium sp. AS2M-Bin002]